MIDASEFDSVSVFFDGFDFVCLTVHLVTVLERFDFCGFFCVFDELSFVDDCWPSNTKSNFSFDFAYVTSLTLATVVRRELSGGSIFRLFFSVSTALAADAPATSILCVDRLLVNIIFFIVQKLQKICKNNRNVLIFFCLKILSS